MLHYVNLLHTSVNVLHMYYSVLACVHATSRRKQTSTYLHVLILRQYSMIYINVLLAPAYHIPDRATVTRFNRSSRFSVSGAA